MAYIHKLKANDLSLYLVTETPGRPKGTNQSLGIPEWLGAAVGREIADRLVDIKFRRDIEEEKPEEEQPAEEQPEEDKKASYSVAQHMRVIARFMELNQ